METITKILTLIPDNWDDVLAQSQRFEGHVDTAHSCVSGQQATIEDLVARAIEFVVIDWTKVDDWLSRTQFYQHLQDVSLDIPALLATPDEMDWSDSTQINALITDKFALLKTAFAGVNIEREEGVLMDTSLALEQLKTVINGIWDVSADIDFSEPESVELFRQRMTETVKPSMFIFINTVFGVDLSESTANTGADSTFSLPQKIQAAQPEPPETFDSALSDEMRTSLEMLSKAKYALPVLQQELNSVTSAQTPLNSLLAVTEDAVVHLQAHLPTLANALTAVLNGQDWQNIDFEQLKSDIEQLCALAVIYLNTSPITEALRTFVAAEEGSSPVRLVGFDETWSTEQKLTQLVTDVTEIVSLPDDFADLAPDAFITLVKGKVDHFATVINHIELFGFTANNVYQRVKTPIESVFSTEGADLSSPEGVAEFLFDKVVLLVNLLSPVSDSASGPPASHETNNPTGESSAEGGVGTQPAGGFQAMLANAGGNMLQFIVKLIAELVEKAKLIWLFIKNNNLGLALKDQDESFTPAALTPTNYQVNAGSVAAANSAENAASTDDSSSSGSADSSSTLPNESSEEPITTPAVREVVSLEIVIRNLLGDRESGVISLLPTQVQDVMLGILDGEYQQKLIDDLTEIWEASGVEQQFNEQYQAFLAMQAPQTDAQGQPVNLTAANVVSQFVAGIGLMYNAGLFFAGQAITLLIDIVFEVINLLFAVVKAFNVPSAVRDILPHQVEDALLGEHDPNLLCLIAAIPTVILTGLLTVPVETIQSWIAEAA